MSSKKRPAPSMPTAPAKSAPGSWSARLGMPTSRSNTTQDQLDFRAKQTIRAKTVKPSMPKMPWDKD